MARELENMIVGFTCGSFDLFHAGHILMLKECKKSCDFLIVGVQTNPSIDRPEKNKPIQSVVERQLQVGACKYVDEILVYETEKDLEFILSILDIKIRFMGEDHRNGFVTGREICEKRDISVVFTKRDHGLSTSALRERIKCS